MSRDKRSAVEQVAWRFKCDYCGARSYYWCMSKRGAWSVAKLHANRLAKAAHRG